MANVCHSSSGLLLYAAMVDLLAEDFLSEEARRTMTSKDRKLAFFMVLMGGKWFPNFYL
jgi:zinc transporter 1/2/3